MRWVTTFASIYTTGLVGFALPSFGAHFPLPLLPGGLAVAAIYGWGRRMWAPIFAASAAIQLALSDAGGSLEKALQGLARRASMSGTPVRFQIRRTVPLAVPTEASDHIYRIAQEAVQNALKHASASAIDIELWTDNSMIGLSILDDGRGLPTGNRVHKGLGMRTMHFRASAIGGVLAIEPLANGGTAVRCEAPLWDTVPVSG
jgi:signal transduction histidine kinase